jgi:hypothetical protein
MVQTPSPTLLRTHGPDKPQNEISGRSREKTNEIQAGGNINPELRSSLSRALEELDACINLSTQPGLPDYLHAESVHKKTMRNGLL